MTLIGQIQILLIAAIIGLFGLAIWFGFTVVGGMTMLGIRLIVGIPIYAFTVLGVIAPIFALLVYLSATRK